MGEKIVICRDGLLCSTVCTNSTLAKVQVTAKAVGWGKVVEGEIVMR